MLWYVIVTIVDAQQVKLISNYRNTKYKLLKTKAYNSWANNAMVFPKMV